MNQDITNRSDVELLVDTFYGKVMTNEVIGFIFSDVVGIDWSKHLPKMYNFWSSLLFGERNYSGNPMRVHVALSKLTEMGSKEFGEWLRLFDETVDELFEGNKANEAKARASKIASLMQIKIKQTKQSSLLIRPDNQ